MDFNSQRYKSGHFWEKKYLFEFRHRLENSWMFGAANSTFGRANVFDMAR